MAQLVNVIGPIMTETGGPAWRQTLFHPFALAARYARGRVMQTKVETGSYSTPSMAEVPYLIACVTEDPATGINTVMALNRNMAEATQLEVELRGLGANRQLVEASDLHHPDLKATNTAAAPDTVRPQPNRDVVVDGERITAKLKPGSWTIIVTRAETTPLGGGIETGMERGSTAPAVPQSS